MSLPPHLLIVIHRNYKVIKCGLQQFSDVPFDKASFSNKPNNSITQFTPQNSKVVRIMVSLKVHTKGSKNKGRPAKKFMHFKSQCEIILSNLPK